ncbi:unnamed protein product [Parnassius apollo]|uniref:(apollo) hypothetical protein n=1 Tax=Parnassius apollo TaxID=110799 RepID=A0A8S3X5F1_PARAO|nr:unnamed protein product [Parnassius apollo]
MSLSQEERIRNWLEEDSDEDVIGGEDDEEGGDEIEPQISEHETDTEEECDSEPEAITENQNIGSSSEDDVPLSHLQTSQCYVVHRKLRNGRTEVIYRWRKQPPPPTCRTRSQNIVTHLPGPKAICRGADTAEKAWILLFSKECGHPSVKIIGLEINKDLILATDIAYNIYSSNVLRFM